jgi:Asp-tRNA(Asn)/Glu-tRNA(Gln) amidotransferase A subunit family amidase
LHNKLTDLETGTTQVKLTGIHKALAVRLQKPLIVIVVSVGLAACQSGQPLDIVETTIGDIQDALVAGETSCHGVVSSYLQRIETYDQSSGINAIIVTNPTALAKADEVDRALASNESLPELFCTPIVVKDNFDTHDMITTGGSITLLESYPPDDAFMVRKLREAGAIIIAKTNMAEWAFSPRETVSSSFGRTANAYDTNFVPAGSSGGTASAVAANFAVAGMGSDTGNSIRGPSSHLALFGIRSTLGLTSRDGVIPLIFDRDVAGPMTRSVEDGVKLFNVVAGYDPNDSLSVPNRREADYREFLKQDGLNGKRIGVFRRLVDHDTADAEIKQLFFDALDDMSSAGATVVDFVAIENFDTLNDTIQSCGSFRYDLKQYLSSLDEPPLLDVSTVLESGQFAIESKGSLEFFSQFPLDTAPDERQDPCLIWPNHPLRNQLLENTVRAMDAANLDALIYPTWSNPPAHIDNANEEYLGDNSQLLVPAAGLPAVTVPMGFWQDKLPAGIQVVGRPYAEGTLIEIAYSYEQLTKHRKPPQGFPALIE